MNTHVVVVVVDDAFTTTKLVLVQSLTRVESITLFEEYKGRIFSHSGLMLFLARQKVFVRLSTSSFPPWLKIYWNAVGEPRAC